MSNPRPTCKFFLPLEHAASPAVREIANALNAELRYIHDHTRTLKGICQLFPVEDGLEVTYVHNPMLGWMRRRPGWTRLRPEQMIRDAPVLPVTDASYGGTQLVVDRAELMMTLWNAAQAITKQQFKKGLIEAMAAAVMRMLGADDDETDPADHAEVAGDADPAGETDGDAA